MRVAALQTVSTPRLTDNLARAAELLALARAAGAELAVLPEYFVLMGLADTDKLALAEADGDGGPMQTWLAAQAREHGLWIVGGTVPLRVPGDPQRVFNSCLVHAPDGSRVARYDKIHLFRFATEHEAYDEARVLRRGQQPVYFDLPSRDGHRWRVGLSVCYDLRFPELYRQYADAGVDLITVPAAFTHTTGQAHWELLLRARAVENLSPVIAAAQGGVHESGRRTWGHAMVVGPWGEVLAVQAQGWGMAVAELDATELARCRSQLPALSHRTAFSAPVRGAAA
ncbi:acyltransferase [Comamonas serinivorans]|uniref:Acyltransferase n=1 Tax=Comamonas serinivorans TaxID=1082851 RepID=A0A1Y0EJH2_9BURK|nr:carbon-nitrogen hydrolase family protein [Comamonas serinivorans]ARU03727.1 acyltransferase [Comamonas serinivorans]